MFYRTRYPLACVLCGILILGACGASFGRVFWRRRARTPSEVLNLSRNWNRLLASEVRINDGRGNLEVLGYDGDMESAMRQIRRTCAADGKHAEFTRGDGMEGALIKSNSGMLRIIAVDGLQPDRTLVFVIEQTLEEYRQSLAPPADYGISQVPAFPGSVIQTFIYVENTRAQLEISTAAQSPGHIYSFFESAMIADGWTQMLPSTAYAGVALFQKGREICCVLVQHARAAPASVIAVLHKRMESNHLAN